MFGFIDKSGVIKIPALHFDFVLQESCIIINDANLNEGIIDYNGNPILPTKYDSISIEDNGFIIVKQNKKYGLFNSDGREILPTKYDDITLYPEIEGFNYIKVEISDFEFLVDYDGIEYRETSILL